MHDRHFADEWKFLTKIIHDTPRHEATKACLEFALYLRALDEEQGLTDFWKKTRVPAVGTLYLKDGKVEPLSPREMSNKIIHAERIDWDFSSEPKLICVAWEKGEREMGSCGNWTSPEHTIATSRSKPGRCIVPDPERPRSSSITVTDAKPASAAFARSYCRRWLSRLPVTCAIVD
jgi:hypothetical protein